MADDSALFQATYSFTNPSDLDGPFGTLNLLVKTSNTTSNVAEGSVYLQLGLATSTTLQFSESAVSTENSNFISVQAKSHGILHAFPDQPKPIFPTIDFVLQADYKAGSISIEGFLVDYGLTLTSLDSNTSIP